jgi:D-cysteine desulfhydrase
MNRSDQQDRVALFRAYPAVKAMPWTSIGEWPTPIDPPRAFAKRLDLPHLYIKREDRSHALCGGNKLRGLEFLLGEAAAKGARTILTFGAAGSHHVAKTAWHARQMGMDTVAVVVPQARSTYVRRNILSAASVNTRYVAAQYVTLIPKLAIEYTRLRLRGGGRKLCYVPAGGTSASSILGHVSAALELKEQIKAGVMPEPDYLYVPMGSLGTAAGLMLGLKLAGLKTRVVGVVVSYRWYCTAGRCARMARGSLRLLRRLGADVPELSISADDIELVGTSLGEGYALFTSAAIELARRLHEDDKVALDGTYSSKALHGMRDFIRARGLERSVHLFWNTYAPSPHVEMNKSLVEQLPRVIRAYFNQEVQSLDAELPHHD